MTTLQKQFKSSRGAAVPLVCCRTADPAATLQSIIETANGQAPPIILWDIVRGCTIKNEPGLAACWTTFLRRGPDDPLPTSGRDLAAAKEELMRATVNLIDTLSLAEGLPPNTILLLSNAQQYWTKPEVIQGIWNLRDLYKTNMRQLVLLATLGAQPPVELSDDTLVIDDPLPSEGQMTDIVIDQYKSAGIENPPHDEVVDAVSAITGIAAFPAEQAVAMSFVRRKGAISLDLDGLWERKRRQVETVPGLTIYRGKERFADIGGNENAKRLLNMMIEGRCPPRAILFQDEIEKQMAGSSGDSSGTSQGQLGKLLTWSQAKNKLGQPAVNGLLLLGHPGAGKSAICKALANEVNGLLIEWDMGNSKDSLVGNTEARTAQVLNMVDAVGQGQVLWIATCNAIDKLAPALQARFTLGTLFFDLPDAAERDVIWKIYMRRYELPDQQRPEDNGWVGREIESCCHKAWMFNISLMQASEFVVVGSIANAESISKLRREADGRYISASYNGSYRMGSRGAAEATTQPPSRRQLNIAAAE